MNTDETTHDIHVSIQKINHEPVYEQRRKYT